MLKLLVILFSLSTGLLAKDIETTVRDIEIEKNAKCDYSYSGNSYCLNNYCRQNVVYSCLSVDGSFNLKMGVSYIDYNGRISNITVRKITYLY